LTDAIRIVPALKRACDVVEPHPAMTDNVRAALAFVARGEARLGIAYATPTQRSPA
jgi:molybdate transport system substrate-binding protein